MELYCPELKTYIDLADASFSIQADSQFQDLENYTCCNSFDLKLINNETNNIIIKGVAKVIDGEIVTDYTVLLMHNNSPLLTGRLVYQGSTPDTITAVYQAFPYGTAFKHFIFRNKLKDYFQNTYIQNGSMPTMKHLFEFGGNFIDKVKAKRVDRLRPDEALTQDITHWLNLERLNFTLNSPESSFPIRNNHFTSLSIPDMAIGMLGEQYKYAPFFMRCKVLELLDCMGIEVPDGYKTELEKFYLYTPVKVKNTIKVKVRYTVCGYTEDPLYGQVVKKVVYGASQTSDIWVWDDTTNKWLGAATTNTNDLTPVSIIGNFASSLRSNKALKGLTVDYVDADIQPQLNSLQINSQEIRQNSLFNMVEGQTFEEGAFFCPYLYCLTNQLSLVPQVVDVVYSLEVDKDCNNYYDNGISSTYWADVPYFETDFAMFDIDTNEFLNMLSLNCRSFSWLRNPMYLSPENADVVWGQHGAAAADFIDDTNIISFEKTIQEDAENSIRVKVPLVAETSTNKVLNYTDNEEKVVTHNLVSLSYTNAVGVESNKSLQSFPPLLYGTVEGKDERFFFGEMYGVVGWESYDDYLPIVHKSTQKPFKVYKFMDDNADFDYLQKYQDHREKYKLKCTGYKMHDKVYINRVPYAVGNYKTDDFVVFELELYKIND